MLNKIFIILALVCVISFADEVENCVYDVSQSQITFYCDYNGGNSNYYNYEFSFQKSDITHCTETITTESSITTLKFRSFYYDKTVEDELGATIESSRKFIDVKDECRDAYSYLKSISTRDE